MARHLFFAITFIGIGMLFHSQAEAVPDAARCEDQAANCQGRCVIPNLRNCDSLTIPKSVLL